MKKIIKILLILTLVSGCGKVNAPKDVPPVDNKATKLNSSQIGQTDGNQIGEVAELTPDLIKGLVFNYAKYAAGYAVVVLGLHAICPNLNSNLAKGLIVLALVGYYLKYQYSRLKQEYWL
jgi:hypothetical protein